MKEIGCPPEIVMRHRPTAVRAHLLGRRLLGRLLRYIWADTLTADAAEAFVEAGSFYDKATAKRLHDSIMSVGNSIPPEEAFRNFRGRDVDTNALMRDRGFPVVSVGHRSARRAVSESNRPTVAEGFRRGLDRGRWRMRWVERSRARCPWR